MIRARLSIMEHQRLCPNWQSLVSNDGFRDLGRAAAAKHFCASEDTESKVGSVRFSMVDLARGERVD